MDEGFFIQIVKKAGEMRLSPEKKAAFRQELELAMAVQPLPRRESVVFAVPDWLRAHGLAFACSMAGVVVIVSGTGVSLAAEQSLPGDRLYPVKTEVNERLKGAFLLTPEAKITWEMERVERRLTEADELSSEGRLADDVRSMIEDDATEHADRAEELASDDEKGHVEEQIKEMLESRTRVKASFEKRKIIISEREEGEHDEESEPYDDEENDEREHRGSEEESDDQRTASVKRSVTGASGVTVRSASDKRDDKHDEEKPPTNESSFGTAEKSGEIESHASSGDSDKDGGGDSADSGDKDGHGDEDQGNESSDGSGSDTRNE